MERRGYRYLGLPRSAHCWASQGWSFAQFSGDKLKTTETQAGGARQSPMTTNSLPDSRPVSYVGRYLPRCLSRHGI